MIFLLLPLLVFSQECVLRDINYSKLTKPKNDPYLLSYPAYTFHFNICGPVDDNGNVAVAIADDVTYSLGKYSTQEPFTDNNGNGFKYAGGSKSRSGNLWSSSIYIKCDNTVTKDIIQVSTADFDKATVSFEIRGPSACVVEESKKSLSPVAIIFIIIAVIVCVILIVFGSWCLVNFFIGKRGIAVLPLYSIFHKQQDAFATEKANLI
ncbi:hypothetical protein EHI8A_063230 [Entamoeba histolytica HM-1:IMSS-B]|uniref:Uncharacterized protein n=7 Tax=Entamoeba histolytica TaxID=5759 RepID=C4LWP4_ENTH1|nr:hypothetical protein EHI_069560 [Entamoeba histolytica HM-1:IMSS]EMD49643.1 Hypothetical protein EHI5A_095880 [Entamoeba histolytica KU27]EMH77717.1 hypothetical protein EHI8A_063230 [Entamoeba histolytica HM-1:IMSS-B]EMS16299.1 hypothetical protein KM1_089870 [Entamoeba histolytica HM-3:IMSS]ENY62028.1 hypothetical protein EHI7A_065750 [Entamoeba histolytica HM-1:IMSS-A]BAN39341.1 hypothetical protein [Entamoeba histolytica]|eukprot:XP_650881.1 hypothetical protein EHI_069560 [Entamoeba histolytica HM-1:IMSS]